VPLPPRNLVASPRTTPIPFVCLVCRSPRRRALFSPFAAIPRAPPAGRAMALPWLCPAHAHCTGLKAAPGTHARAVACHRHCIPDLALAHIGTTPRPQQVGCSRVYLRRRSALPLLPSSSWPGPAGVPRAYVSPDASRTYTPPSGLAVALPCAVAVHTRHAFVQPCMQRPSRGLGFPSALPRAHTGPNRVTIALSLPSPALSRWRPLHRVTLGARAPHWPMAVPSSHARVHLDHTRTAPSHVARTSPSPRTWMPGSARAFPSRPCPVCALDPVMARSP
jgi:hypothetical protein